MTNCSKPSILLINKRKSLLPKKQVTALATVKVNNAQASYDAANKEYNLAVSDRDLAQDRYRNAQSQLKAAQENLNLAQT